MVDVEQLFVVVDKVLAHVGLAGGASEVRGFKTVDGQQGWTPDCGQVVVGHEVHGALGCDGVQVTDDSSQGLIVKTRELPQQVSIPAKNE